MLESLFKVIIRDFLTWIPWHPVAAKLTWAGVFWYRCEGKCLVEPLSPRVGKDAKQEN